jgi:long-chain acyl-CoA synthetase
MERPRWADRYPEGVEPTLVPRADSMLAAWRSTVARLPDAPGVHYLDRDLSFASLDETADALAVALAEGGTGPGDRVGIYLQNDPQWLVGMVATWKLGAIPVAINPMLKARELRHHLDTAGVTTLLCLESLYRDVVVGELGGSGVGRVITTHPLDLVPDPGGDVAWLGSVAAKDAPEEADDLADLLEEHRGARPPERTPGAEDVAMLTFTSGTTGAAKGAMNLHGGMVHSSQVFTEWFDLDERDVVLGMAPLFHITGSVAGMGVTILSGAPLVLAHRFDAAETLRLIEERGCTFGVGAITAFIALANDPTMEGRDLSGFAKVASGGASVSPPVVERIREQTGMRIHPVYGLTETTSPTHMTPPGVEPPVDPDSGALAVGIPVPGVQIRIVDIETGTDLEQGEEGEIVVSGPMVVPGYWDNPEATAHAIRDGWLFTGDIGIVDEEDWLFVVDRKKDLINAGGYKIWPREVEDVLYEHPAVREAAVVGVPDEYRGETVKAVVSRVPGAEVSEEELIAFCRDNLAAYKYPRVVEIREELPKTSSGKLLRRALRDG